MPLLALVQMGITVPQVRVIATPTPVALGTTEMVQLENRPVIVLRVNLVVIAQLLALVHLSIVHEVTTVILQRRSPNLVPWVPMVIVPMYLRVQTVHHARVAGIAMESVSLNQQMSVMLGSTAEKKPIPLLPQRVRQEAYVLLEVIVLPIVQQRGFVQLVTMSHTLEQERCMNALSVIQVIIWHS